LSSNETIEDESKDLELASKQKKKVIRLLRAELVFDLYIEDIAIWLYGIIAIFLAAMVVINNLVSTTSDLVFHLFYLCLIMGGLLFWKIFRKPNPEIEIPIKINQRFKKAIPYIILVLNILILLIFSSIYLGTGKLSFEEVRRHFLIASWEQMLFAVIIPILLLKLFQYKLQIEKISISPIFIVILISSIMFSLSHWLKYGHNPWITIGMIFVGYVLHFLGFYIPSFSITLHWLFNTLQVAFP
jgi:hypothetical protein